MSDASGNVTFSTTFSGNNCVTFGDDAAGELYVTSIGNGTIYKIIDSSLSTTEFGKTAFSIYPESRDIASFHQSFQH